MTDTSRRMPGRVNAHTHLYSGLAPLGMPAPERQPRSFQEILELVWWRLDRALDEESLAAAARLYVSEALLAGTTTLVDHHESPELINGSLDILADACQDLGVRALLCYGATERNRGRDEALAGLDECRRFLTSNRRPLVRGAVAIHASFTVSDQTLADAGDLCRELDTVLHIHLAEGPEDDEDARSRRYDSALHRLLELGALVPGSILAHGVHLDEAQVRLCQDHKVWLVQNPRSNKGNGVGYPPALSASDRVALGTDGYPADMLQERAALLEEVRQYGDDEGKALVRYENSRSLAGELFHGFTTDVVDQGPDGKVLAVAVAGRQVVRDGQLVDGDLPSIRDQAQDAAERLWSRMARIPG